MEVAIKGARDQKFPKILDYFSLFGCLRGGSMEREDPGRGLNMLIRYCRQRVNLNLKYF